MTATSTAPGQLQDLQGAAYGQGYAGGKDKAHYRHLTLPEAD